MQGQSLGWEDFLEKEMATHSSMLTWKIPWTEKPGGLCWGCKELVTTEHSTENTVSKKKKKDWELTVAQIMNSLLPNLYLN